MKLTSDIKIRDPFILVDNEKAIYYLYGTTDLNVWDGPGTGFDVYQSKDLVHWEGPLPAFRPAADFWAKTQFWAPEVHIYQNQYYMFATFKAEGICRGTQILCANSPVGPFIPLTELPVTPADWECLDGTLFIDVDENPWMIFCQEWLQVTDGKMCAIKLSEDLKTSVEEPIVLFSASEASWTVAGENGKTYVTDGPFLYRNQYGELLMLWSSSSANGYAIGIARSTSGTVEGPWTHEDEPLFDKDGGHGMLFRDLTGQLMLTMHTPNQEPLERAIFLPVQEQNGLLQMDKNTFS